MGASVATREWWQNNVSPHALERAVAFSESNGGGTFAVPSLFPMHPTRGYAVGLGSPIVTSDGGLALAIDTLARRITGRCCVGTWRDPESGLWHVEQSYLDPSLAEAIEKGRAYGQRFVWGFREACGIPTGVRVS